MSKHTWRLLLGILVIISYFHSADAQTLQWARQFASPVNAAYQLAADSSGVYIAGITLNALPGQTKLTISGAQSDGFLRKYDSSGNVLWTREFAVTDPANPQFPRPLGLNGLAVDSSGVYIVGTSGGSFKSNEGSGNLAVVMKFDANGTLLWTHQTIASRTLAGESADAVALSGGAVFVVGQTAGVTGTTATRNAYLRKLDSSGNEIWTTAFTTSGSTVVGTPEPFGVAADASGEYIVGNATGSLTGQPVAASQILFTRKYDTNGNALWTDQFGATTTIVPDHPYGVSVSSSGVYVAGVTGGLLGIQTLPVFGADAWLRKYDAASGKVQWTQQFGTADNDAAFGVLADDTGAYTVGYTKAVLGAASIGGTDAFVRRFDANGNALWTIQTGSVNLDFGFGVATDATGIYIGGYTDVNTIPFTLTNKADSFLHKFSFPAAGGPVISTGGIVSNASFAPSPQPVAPGSIVAIFGTGLDDGSQVLSSAFGADGKLVTTLGGASVTVGGVAAPMFYATSGQLGIQIPYEMAGQSSAPVQVTVGGQTSVAANVNITSIKPGLFTTSQDGRGTAVCLHSDGITPATADNPAHPGEVVILYGTGFGPLSTPLGTGSPSAGNLTVSDPTITIDGLPAQVMFSGMAPGFVGLNQINVLVPGLARTNAAEPIVVTINSVAANAVTLPVGP